MIGWCLVCDETFTTLDDLEWHNKVCEREPYKPGQRAYYSERALRDEIEPRRTHRWKTA